MTEWKQAVLALRHSHTFLQEEKPPTVSISCLWWDFNWFYPTYKWNV